MGVSPSFPFHRTGPWLASLALAILLPGPALASAQVVIPLGDQATVEALFPVPAGKAATLPAVIRHYLAQSARRDGLTGVSVSVEVTAGAWQARLRSTLPIPPDYPARLARFLEIGAEGAQAVTTLRQAGTWDEKSWRFLLPLGLPLERQRAVQLMHFPPDYAVTRGDYLDSQTSHRWEALLRANGVARAEVVEYEDIVDIGPIAAPSSTGASLTAALPAFESYARDMLLFALAPVPAHPGVRPLVAYGYPARSWLESELHLALPVLGLASLTLPSGQVVPVLGANHPSYIWYAVKVSRPLALKVMGQDLIAACWQAAMGGGAAGDPAGTLTQCRERWDARLRDACILVEREALGHTAAQAKAACRAPAAALRALATQVSDEEAAGMERGATWAALGR